MVPPLRRGWKRFLPVRPGKLLQGQKRIGEAVFWYERAAAQGDQYAAYRLGKLYLQGEQIPKDVPKALEYLTASARQGNQYAQYKLYLTGEDVTQDRKRAFRWFQASASQGNEYAQFFLNHFHDSRGPMCFWPLLSCSTTWAGSFVPPSPPGSQRADRKLLQKLRQKKIALGHKVDDHEEQQHGGWNMTMGGM